MSQTYIPAALECLVAERSRGQCEYCHCLTQFNSDPFAIEHIVPQVLGGSTDEANLAYSCLGCNSFKGAFQTAIDPVTDQLASLFHPRRQAWTDHFTWSDDTTQMVGITATGRATIVRLRLNRHGPVNLRAALHRFGVHPPD